MNRYKSMKSILLASLMLCSLALLSAWSITDTYFGNKLLTLDARSQAMGGSGTFNDLRPFGISTNPANLTLMQKTLGLQGGMHINRNEDNRHVPLYNSFDNYIDDAVYASNINFFDDYAGAGFGSYRFGAFRLGLGAYYKPLLSFDGIYKEEIRNNRNTDNDGYPEKIAINEIRNEGLLNQMAGVFSLGYQLDDNLELNLGADFSLLNGSVNNLKTIRWSQWAINTAGQVVLPEFTQEEDYELEGNQIKAGLAIRANRRFGFGATYIPKTTLDRTGSIITLRDAYLGQAAIGDTTAISEDYILPPQTRIGINYQPRNIMRTWFNLDVEYVQYSEISGHFDDVFNFYAGVEHHVENRLPLRLGFQAVNTYLRNVEADGSIIAKKIITPMITAGSSFELVKGIQLDLGFGYSWREYEALDLFPDGYYNDKQYTGSSSYILWPNQYIALTNRGWENPDKVRENNISLSASLTFTW